MKSQLASFSLFSESEKSQSLLIADCYHQEQNINEVVSEHKESLTSWKTSNCIFNHLVFQSEANWGPISGAGYLWKRELSQIYLKVCVIFRIAWICPNITYIFSKVKFSFDMSNSCPRHLSMYPSPAFPPHPREVTFQNVHCHHWIL